MVKGNRRTSTPYDFALGTAYSVIGVTGNIGNNT